MSNLKKYVLLTCILLSIALFIIGGRIESSLAQFLALISFCVGIGRLVYDRIRQAGTETQKGRFFTWIRYIWYEKPKWAQTLFITSSWLFLGSGVCGMVYSFATNTTIATDGTEVTQTTPLEILAGFAIPIGFICFIIGLALYVGKRTSTKHGSAHIASLNEMQAAGFTQSNAQGLELGRYFHKLIGLSQQQQESHVLLIAPTGKGKTSGVIIPALLQENGNRSLVINDVKGELIAKCAGALTTHYKIKIFSPTRPQQSHFYNPLAHVQTYEDAEDIADTWIQNTGTSQQDPFWDRAAAMLITAVILHLTQGARTIPPFSAVANILTSMTLDHVSQLLTNSPSLLARQSMVTFLNSVANNPKLGGSIMLEVASRFRLLNNPGIQTVTSKSEFQFDALIDHASAWFLSIPASDARRLKPLSACFYMQMMKRLTKRAEESTTGRLPYPIAFYLDEFVNAGRIMHFEEHISLVRSAGIAFLLAVQDFGQLKREYGEDVADTILANATTHLVFPGCGQKECQYYSDRIGDTTTFSQSIGYSIVGEGIGLTVNDSETRRRLMNPDEIRTMQYGTLLVLHSNTPPLLVANVPYYQRRELIERVNLPFSYPKRPQQPQRPPAQPQRPPEVIYMPPRQGAATQNQQTQGNDPFTLP